MEPNFTHEIKDIGSDDAFYWDRKKYIGKGIDISDLWPKHGRGWLRGVARVEGIDCSCVGNRLCFLSVKVRRRKV